MHRCELHGNLCEGLTENYLPGSATFHPVRSGGIKLKRARLSPAGHAVTLPLAEHRHRGGEQRTYEHQQLNSSHHTSEIS
jgi:hypothetical protein